MRANQNTLWGKLKNKAGAQIQKIKKEKDMKNLK